MSEGHCEQCDETQEQSEAGIDAMYEELHLRKQAKIAELQARVEAEKLRAAMWMAPTVGAHSRHIGDFAANILDIADELKAIAEGTQAPE